MKLALRSIEIPSRVAVLAWTALVASSSLAFAQGAEGAPPAAEARVERPRLGFVLKTGGEHARRAFEELGRTLAVEGIEVDFVELKTAPTKSKPVPDAPRFVLVLEAAKCAKAGPTTEEYELPGGGTARIRWRGATATAHASVYENVAPVREIADLDVWDDQTHPPESYVFPDTESKVEIVVEPETVLRGVIDYMVRQALANAAALDLWPDHEALLGKVKALRGTAAAEFWTSAAWVAAEREPRRAVVPWRTLNLAAVAVWREAYALAQRGHPETACAWCGVEWKVTEGDCDCAEARTLSAARAILTATAGRKEGGVDRKDAQAIEVAWDKLQSGRPPKAGEETSALTKRIEAEHAADRNWLGRRWNLEMKPEPRLEWYVILALNASPHWEPEDADLVLHAARTIQAFPIRYGYAGASFDVEATRPTSGLVKRRTGWEYSAIEKREFNEKDLDVFLGQLERAMWANARGVPKAP